MSDPNNNPPLQNELHEAGRPQGAEEIDPPIGETRAEPHSGDPEGLATAGESQEDPATGSIADLQAQLAEEKERYIRAIAEMENVRRRAAEDVSKAHKFSIESFAEALIPVKDSLEMALKVDAPTVESLNEGVEATLRQLVGAFERNQLVEIDPLGHKFDPNRHQAISMMPASATNPPVEPNHVATVLQKGYLINDRVLRPALVVVAEA